MKAHIPWIQSYVDTSVSTEELAERLTIAGIEIDAIESIGAYHSRSVVGVVRENGAVEESDHLRLLQLDAGGEHLVQVVTGAPNAVDWADGTRVALALPGGVLISPDGPSGGTWVVKSAKLMGIPSQGVLCSSMELGLSEDNEGVLVLDQGSAGQPLRELLQASGDTVAGDVLEIAILPNIARCQSIRGLSSEVASIFGADLRFEPEMEALEVASGSLDPDVVPECVRFCVAVVDHVAVKPSPWWVQARLLASGIIPKNNIVDASNYVMLELGQPTHAYDAAKLTSEKIDCRFAKEGESFLPLGQGDDPTPIALPASVLTITNDDKVVSVAGVIGGAETAVSDSTTRLVLESANFDYLTVRRGQRLIDTFTDASQRFGRGVDPTLPPLGIRRIIHILRETCPDLTVEATAESGQTDFPLLELALDVDVLNGALGTTFDTTRVETLLRQVGFDVTASGTTLQVVVPNMRLDIAIVEDLFEEVARLDGFDRMPETIPFEPVPNYTGNVHLEARDDIEDFLVGQGLQQIMSYTLTSPELEATILLEPTDVQYVELINPMTVDKRVMRRSLLPRLMEIVQENRRAVPYTHLFELGIVVHPEGEGISKGLPAEPWRFGFVMSGPVEDYAPHGVGRDADFFDCKRVLENLMKHLRIPARFVTDVSPIHHPGICARIETTDGVTLGSIGMLHPKVAINLDLDDGPEVFVGEFDLDAIIRASTRDFIVTPPPRMPGIQIDLSLLLDRSLLAGEVVAAIEEASDETLESVAIFDRYVGEHVPTDKMALGVRLGFRDSKRTMTMDEATKSRDAIFTQLADKFGAEQR